MTTPFSLSLMGWSPTFQQQVSLEEWETAATARVIAQHRSYVELLSESGKTHLHYTNKMPAITVGDWLLLDQDNTFIRLLERRSEFSRKAAGSKIKAQLIAANIDTVFIVSSLNKDFSLSRIERYLALVNEAGAEAVIVLTKKDLCENKLHYVQQIHALDPLLMIETVNALDNISVECLLPWCNTGKTLAVLGSSGVGKSTLVNLLLNEQTLETGTIREDDSKGRHTTTARSMHFMRSGAVLIDTPGMRELQLAACEEGVNATFNDIGEYSKQCRYSDCSHEQEPGCAVRLAIEKGELDERRLANFKKLLREQAINGASIAEKRAQDKSLSKMYKTVQTHSRRNKKDPRSLI